MMRGVVHVVAVAIWILLCLGPAQPVHGQVPGLDAPSPVGPFLDGLFPPRTPLAPGSSPWQVVEAFPGLPITNVLVIVPNPADDRLYVSTRDGLIVSFENDAQVAASEPFMDLRDRVAVVWEGGLLGLVFHPEFGTPGSPHEATFYAYYTAYCPVDAEHDDVDFGACNPSYPRAFAAGFFDTWLRLSRFQASWDPVAEVWRGEASSEEPMLSIRLYNFGHRAGGLVFGADGRLYLTIGDQVRHETAQDIVNTLEGGSFRFEVDIIDLGDGTWMCPAGSHLPRRRFQDVSPNPDEMSGRLYCIPDDNPWLDPAGGNYEEYFTIGHRNPYRLSFDPTTGLLWAGEAGESTREEINVLEKGGNYGWPFREGLTSGPLQPPAVILGNLTDPVIDFDRSESAALIGGYVYRGARFPDLQGRFIAGDYVTRNIWAVHLDAASMTATKDLLASFDPGELATFGQDNQGEIYMGSIAPGVPLQRLERIGDPVPDPPALLSEVGAFVDLPSLAVHPAAVPYDLVPFWSDGARKSRWIFLPNDGSHDQVDERIAFSESGNWSFPVGTVLMKHFELPLDENDPSATARLETRFLVLGDDAKWYGVTYRWRDDQSDAELLAGAETRALEVQLAAGGTEQQVWSFPSRSQCMTCHTNGAGGALGVRTHQLNRDLTYPRTGRTHNQLHTWSALGMLDPPLDPAQLPGYLAGARLDDPTASLELRARSWLDSNCSNCHRPETGNRAGFDARLTTPLPVQGFVWGEVMDDLGIPDAYLIHPGDPFASIVFQRVAAVGTLGMPPLAKSRADAQALAILYEWIRRIGTGFPRSGLAYEYYEITGLSVLPDFDSLTPTGTGSVRNFDVSVRAREDNFAFRFSGVIDVPASGAWTFYTRSDDGSQLFVDGTLVVDNDGHHAIQERSGTIQLDAGFHSIVVTMFEGLWGEFLAVDWQGPGVAKQSISAERLFREVPTAGSNSPPTLSNPGAQSASAGRPVQLTLSGSDPDGDLLYYDAAGLPAGLSVHSETGEISGTIGVGATGLHVVTASASDGSEVSAVSFEWSVAPNTAPQVTNPGDRLSTVGDEVALSVVASDGEGGPLGFAASGLPFGLSIDPDTGEIAGTLLRAGVHSVVLSVSDGVETTDAAFTWTVRTRRAGIRYEYYEVAGLSALPDFDALAPDAAAFVSGFDISVRQRGDGFAFRFTGVVDVPTDGIWTFSTRSDDGSQLFVDGVLVVDNDGQHGVRERSGQVALGAGPHDIVVTMFEWIGGETLEVLWEGPGVAQQPIPASRLFSWTTQPASCGIGLELAPLLAGLLWLRRRRCAAGPAGAGRV
jgi:uncharacterized repeat protein (TIGR03806 family)